MKEILHRHPDRGTMTSFKYWAPYIQWTIINRLSIPLKYRRMMKSLIALHSMDFIYAQQFLKTQIFFFFFWGGGVHRSVRPSFYLFYLYILSKVFREKEKILLSPMTKALTSTEKSQKQRDNTKNATKTFDYTTIVDRLRTVI